MQWLHAIPDWLKRSTLWLSGRRRRRKTLFSTTERLEHKALLSAFVVTSPVDEPDALPGDGVAQTASGETTFRAAVQESNASTGPDEIFLPAGLIELALAGSEDDRDESSAASGDLDITDDVRIIGSGSGTTTIDASGIDIAFHIQSGVTLALENLTLTVADDSAAFEDASVAGAEEAGSVIIEDGGVLTLDNASIEEPSVFPRPAVDPSLLTSSERHEELLIGLFQPVVTRSEPLDPLFAPAPVFVSPLNETKPDATIAIGTERFALQLTADRDEGISEEAQAGSGQQTPDVPRVASESPDGRSEAGSQLTDEGSRPARVADPDTPDARRRDLVNSLFQERPAKSGNESGTEEPIQPASGEISADDATSSGNAAEQKTGETGEETSKKTRRLREAFPMLMPLDEAGSLDAAPESSGPNGSLPDRPVPPPFPEPAPERDQTLRSPESRSTHADTTVVGTVLLTMIRPRSIRRAFRRLTHWRNLVV